jgi:serine/threonine-protein kinase
VYLAVADGPSGFQKLVVLKALKKNLADDRELRAMFLSEARLAARLQHPNIVQTYEVIEGDDGTPIIVMEFLDGQPLSQMIVRGRDHGFTLAMQLRVLADALGGLHAAHELADVDGTPLGVVHRDVSPQNLFVTVAGQTKVLDFGIAKLDRSLVETEIGTIKGKLRYMAPEQVAGLRLDRRADVYAAGVILWEALAGERMWKGLAEQEIRARVQAGDLPSAQALRPDLPPALDRICRRALACSPADRHASALEMADEIEATLPALGPPASHREIGATVARLFQDLRAQTKQAIEHKLGPLSGGGVPAAAVDRVVNRTGETSGPIAMAAEATGSLSGSETRPGPELRRRALVLVACGVAITAALVGVGVWKSAVRSQPAAVALPPAPAAAPAPPVPPPSAPPTAVVEPAPPAARPSPVARLRRSGPANRAPAASSAAPAAKPDCAYPMFIDSDGIKRFRPECM